MRAVYAENIEYVMEALERLIDSIDGKIVITSDHGELLGERFTKWKRWLDNRWGTDWDRYTWGHYRDIDVPELVEAPWLELPSESRRQITADRPIDDEFDQSSMDEHLQALGYK